jgi:nicotinamide riboside kinase
MNNNQSIKFTNPKRIAFTGPGSSGKSTIIKEFYEYNDSNHCNDWNHIGSHTRSMKQSENLTHIKSKNDVGDILQLRILNTHLDNAISAYTFNRSITYDRCILDGYIYTRWLYDFGKINGWILEYGFQLLHTLKDQYDHVFYCMPDFEYVQDKDRNIPKKDREYICDLYDKCILYFKPSKVTKLTGNVENRLNIINNVLTTKINDN